MYSISPLDIARLHIGRRLKTKMNVDLNAPIPIKSFISALLIHHCIDEYNHCVTTYNARRFESTFFSASEELPLLREQRLPDGVLPQPGDTFFIVLGDGSYRCGFVERVKDGIIYTIEVNTETEEFEVWRRPDGWPIEQVRWFSRFKISLID